MAAHQRSDQSRVCLCALVLRTAPVFATARRTLIPGRFPARNFGLQQNQVLSLPRRSEAVRLPLFCHNSLCRVGKASRATYAHRYDMLTRGQGAIVGLTLCA
jgi:hypothetical protein